MVNGMNPAAAFVVVSVVVQSLLIGLPPVFIVGNGGVLLLPEGHVGELDMEVLPDAWVGEVVDLGGGEARCGKTGNKVRRLNVGGGGLHTRK